jgi:hypothetical protein
VLVLAGVRLKVHSPFAGLVQAVRGVDKQTAGEQLAGFYVVANLGFCTAIANAAAVTTRWRTRPLMPALK